MPNEIVSFVNNEVDQLNGCVESEKELRNSLKRRSSQILKLVEKELKLVPKNHHRNVWLAVGMSAFGIPIGVAFGASMDNMAFLGVGLPIGMVIGMAVGSRMDKKALEEGKQLDLEVKY